MTTESEITGALVYADRTKRKMSRKDYGTLVGISHNKIMSIENGRVIKDAEIELLRPVVFGEGGAGLDNRDFTHDATVIVPEGQDGLQPIEIGVPKDVLELNRQQPPIFLADKDDYDDEFYMLDSSEENPEGIEEYENENGEVTSFPPTLEGDEDSVGGWFTADPVNVVSVHDADPPVTSIIEQPEPVGTAVAIREKYEFKLEGYHLSNSELQTFKRCHRKWWLAYYRELRLKRADVTGPRAIGTRLHLVLSAYYDEPPQNAWDVFNELAEIDRAKVSDDPDKLANLEKELDLCKIMLEGYFQWLEDLGADDGIEIVGNEEVIEAEFATIRNIVIILVGKLDLRIKRIADQLRLFMDHKSVQSLEMPVLHLDEQLLHYQLLEYLDYLLKGAGETSVGGLYNMLRKVKRTANAKPPFYARREVRHNVEELRSYWLRVYGEATAIMELREKLDAGEDPRQVAYPTPRRDCSWDCDFLQVCPMFDDGSASEEMLGEFFEKHDPHDHYYVETPLDEKTE